MLNEDSAGKESRCFAQSFVLAVSTAGQRDDAKEPPSLLWSRLHFARRTDGRDSRLLIRIASTMSASDLKEGKPLGSILLAHDSAHPMLASCWQSMVDTSDVFDVYFDYHAGVWCLRFLFMLIANPTHIERLL